MTDPITAQPPRLWPNNAYDAAADVTALSEMMRHTMEMAANLTAGGRRVDLNGLDQMVGLLCAKALDLPAADGRTARSGLFALLTAIDALSLTLRAKGSR